MARNDGTCELLQALINIAHSVPPDPEEMNNRRAESALRAICGFGKDIGENLDDVDGDRHLFFIKQNAEDMLANLAHLCDRLGLRFSTLIAEGKYHYDEETDFKGTQFIWRNKPQELKP